MSSTNVAIGMVASAAVSLASHTGMLTVKWRCGLVFAAAGV